MLIDTEHRIIVDTHCHIIPKIDDGPTTLVESLDLARRAVLSGIQTIIATPHYGTGKYKNRADIVLEEVKSLNIELIAQNIPLSILAGQEIRVHSQLIEEICAGKISTLNGTKYILLELPSYGVPSYFDELIYELSILQLVPVIAHPERNVEILMKPDLLRHYVEKGVVCQITAQSVMGLFGRKIQKFSLQLCKNNWVHLVASDAHNLTTRPFMLEQSYTYLGKVLGQEQVNYYKNNALKLIGNENLQLETRQIENDNWFSRWVNRTALVTKLKNQ